MTFGFSTYFGRVIGADFTKFTAVFQLQYNNYIVLMIVEIGQGFAKTAKFQKLYHQKFTEIVC